MTSKKNYYERRLVGVVKSGRGLVGLPARCEHGQHHAVSIASFPLSSAYAAAGWLASGRTADPVVCRLCVRLRLSVGSPSRRCAAHLPLRHLAFECLYRSIGRDNRGSVL